MNKHQASLLCLASMALAGSAQAQRDIMSLVPHEAAFVGRVSQRAVADLTSVMADDDVLKKQLGDHFVERLGVNLMQLGEMAFVVLKDGNREHYAAVSAYGGKERLKGSAKRYRGFEMVRLEGALYAAAIPQRALVYGTEYATKKVLDSAAGQHKTLRAGVMLASLATLGAEDDLVLAFDFKAMPEFRQTAERFAVDYAQARVQYPRSVEVQLIGRDAEKLESLKKMAEGAIALALASGENSLNKQREAKDVAESAAAIVALHWMHKLAKTINLSVQGERLLGKVTLPETLTKHGQTNLAILGVGAAVAIPAFVKYLRRAKAAEGGLE